MAACLTVFASSSVANAVEMQGACGLLHIGNTAMFREAAVQTTDDFSSRGEFPVHRHVETVSSGGAVYKRSQPFQRWAQTKAGSELNSDGTPINGNCQRLRKERVDGRQAIVVAYDKILADWKQAYRCTIWIEIPKSRPLKSVCKGPFTWVRRWSYRSDIKAPIGAGAKNQ